MKLLNSQQKQQLTALIHAQPGLRTIQLSDKLDFDFDAIEDALDVLLDAGAVVAHNVLGPNNRGAKAWTAKGAALPSAPINVFTAPAIKSAVPPSKVAIAINFVKKYGRATGAELADAMGLTRTALLKTYLRDAINDGRIKKVGDAWLLGDGKAPKPSPTAPGPVSTFKEVKATILNEVLACHAPAAVLELPPEGVARAEMEMAGTSGGRVSAVAAYDPKAALTLLSRGVDIDSAHHCSDPQEGAKEPAKNTTKTGNTFRVLGYESKRPLFGMWSDGSLHIAREGEAACVLAPWEVKELHEYISRCQPPAHPELTPVDHKQ